MTIEIVRVPILSTGYGCYLPYMIIFWADMGMVIGMVIGTGMVMETYLVVGH